MLFWHLSRWLFLLVCCFRTREQEHGLHAKRPHDGYHHATHFKATVLRPYRSPRFATLANYVNHNRFKFCQHVVLFLFLKIPVTNGLADTKKKKNNKKKKKKKKTLTFSVQSLFLSFHVTSFRMVFHNLSSGLYFHWEFTSYGNFFKVAFLPLFFF